MTNRIAWGIAVMAALVGAVGAETGTKSTEPQAKTAVVARGKYLVEGVGKCGDCHTPMTDKGPDLSKNLAGAPIMFKPTIEIPWAEIAPGIAGMPMLSDKDAVTFLMTGKLPDGSRPRPPMPEYTLNKADATAVVAYLKSLK